MVVDLLIDVGVWNQYDQDYDVQGYYGTCEADPCCCAHYIDRQEICKYCKVKDLTADAYDHEERCVVLQPDTISLTYLENEFSCFHPSLKRFVVQKVNCWNSDCFLVFVCDFDL